MTVSFLELLLTFCLHVSQPTILICDQSCQIILLGFCIRIGSWIWNTYYGAVQGFLMVTVIISFHSGKNTEMLTLSWFNLKWRICSVLSSAYIFIIDWLIDWLKCLFPLDMINHTVLFLKRKDVEAYPAGLVWESDWLCSGHSSQGRSASSEKPHPGSGSTTGFLQCGECGYIRSMYVIISTIYVKLQMFGKKSVD